DRGRSSRKIGCQLGTARGRTLHGRRGGLRRGDHHAHCGIAGAACGAQRARRRAQCGGGTGARLGGRLEPPGERACRAGHALSGAALKRTCMRDHIRTVLVARILDGTYPAGTQLKELSLAREFNVSQAPIREALRELEGSGLVTCERFRGTRVRGADFNEMLESYELRATLEVRAVELAIPCAPDVITQLEKCFGLMKA